MWTLYIKKDNKVEKFEVETPAEIKAIFDQNKGSQYKLYQRGTSTFHSPQYVQMLLKSIK